MVRCIIVLIVSILFLSCSGNDTTGESVTVIGQDTTSQDTAATHADSALTSKQYNGSVKLQEFQMQYKRIVGPVTFSEHTPVYKRPDTSSIILKMYDFNTSVQPIEDSYIDEWMQVKLNSDTVYLRTEDFAVYSFTSLTNKSLKYYIVEKGESSLIYKYNITQHKWIDTFEVQYFIADRISQLDVSKWQNTDLLICMNYNGNCCGCSDNQYYVIDANGKFEILFKTFQRMDDGDIEGGYEAHVSLPADPQTEDIIYSDYEYGALHNKRGEVIVDRKGVVQTGTLKDVKIHYKWDGQQLIEQKK
ncbi:hypothetical protein [Cytophaga aurantiaca]|uniref:hypothetical protein n=1 Tax=Cytophaga aurantiaca TaxID=29530 RepID=UPI00037ADD2B|nr:hypothetical protein [Cytophaga aurantiaca]